MATVRVEALQARYDGLLARIEALEQRAALDQTPEQRVCERQLQVLRRIDALGQALGVAALPPVSAAAAACTPSTASAAAPAAKPRPTVTPDASPTQQRLEQELIDRGLSEFKFIRVPQDYYDQPLEFRRACLDAPTLQHLCKSIVMENTRAHPSVQGWTDPSNSKYFVIIVQYTARLHSDKLKAHVQRLAGGKHGSKYYNMRLAPEDVNDALTGFSHNAVTPVGMREPLPIILSHRIAQLQPPMFWMGGGEVDLKLGVQLDEFVQAYNPIVVDCTYDAEVKNGDIED